jgi:Ca2+-binding EF-hand superfamily protein
MFWYDRQNFPNFYTADLAIHPVPTADRNGDGVIDCADLKIVRTSLGTKMGEPGFDPHADVNQDGAVDVKDLAFVAQQLPGGSQCPSRDE